LRVECSFAKIFFCRIYFQFLFSFTLIDFNLHIIGMQPFNQGYGMHHGRSVSLSRGPRPHEALRGGLHGHRGQFPVVGSRRRGDPNLSSGREHPSPGGGGGPAQQLAGCLGGRVSHHFSCLFVFGPRGPPPLGVGGGDLAQPPAGSQLRFFSAQDPPPTTSI